MENYNYSLFCNTNAIYDVNYIQEERMFFARSIDNFFLL